MIEESKYSCGSGTSEENIITGLGNVHILKGIDIAVTYLNSVLAELPEAVRESTRKKIIDRIGEV